MAKDLGKVAGELKEVPKEFAEGMKESETSAKDGNVTQVVDVLEDKKEKVDA